VMLLATCNVCGHSRFIRWKRDWQGLVIGRMDDPGCKPCADRIGRSLVLRRDEMYAWIQTHPDLINTYDSQWLYSPITRHAWPNSVEAVREVNRVWSLWHGDSVYEV
jgi:hypothetical protein